MADYQPVHTWMFDMSDRQWARHEELLEDFALCDREPPAPWNICLHCGAAVSTVHPICIRCDGEEQRDDKC